MKLRVLYISTLYPGTADGLGGSFVVPLFDRLKDRCDIRVVRAAMTPFYRHQSRTQSAQSWDPRILSTFDAAYVPKFGLLNGLLYANRLSPVIDKLLPQFRPDVLLGYWMYPDAFAVMLEARKRRLPFVCGAPGSDVHTFLKFPLRRRQVLRVARAANAVIAYSGHIRDELVDNGIDCTKISVLYNGVNHDQFHPLDRHACCAALGLEANKRRILFVGGFSQVKNISTLIQAVARLEQQGTAQSSWELVLAGDGGGKQQVIREVQASPVQKSIHITPAFVPKSQIPLWMNASDILCLPSLNEGVPNVILESLACGLPVVASRVGGIPEVLPPEAGVLVDAPTNSEELAHKIHYALHHRWNRQSIVDYSRRFSWNQAANLLVNVLTHAVSQQK